MTPDNPVQPHVEAYVGPEMCMCQLHIQWLRLRLAFVRGCTSHNFSISLFYAAEQPDAPRTT